MPASRDVKVDGARPDPVAVPARPPGPTLGQAPSQTSGQSPGRSFAEVLATGKTVSEIRSERALGFSETGLFGVSRAQQHAASGILESKSSPPMLVGRSPASEFARPPARPPVPVARTAPITDRSSEPESQILPARAQARSTGLAPDGNIARPVTQSLRFTLQASRAVAKLPFPIAQRRKRVDALEIIGADTSLTVIVNDAGDQSESAALLRAFVQLASAFGVTIKSVMLDRARSVF